MTNKGKRFPPRTVTREQAEALLAACGAGVRGIRDRAILVVLYRAGLRCAECCSLAMGDVRAVSGGMVVRVERPKGYELGKLPREVGLDPKAQEFIERWLEARGPGPGPLFMTSRGSPILPSHVRRLCGRLGQKAGIEGRIHPHALRHTFAAEWYREQPDRIVELMLALGHTKITVTQRYLRDIGSTDVVKLSINRSW